MTKDLNSLFGLCAGGLIAAALTACGGGGGASVTSVVASVPTATFTGTFTDAPVAGASYFTSSGSGGCAASAPCTTSAQGQFKYAPGDAVTFVAAGITLGSTSVLQPSADGSTTVTPVSLVSGATLPTDPGPTAIAQFLQTLSNISASTSGNGGSGVLTMPADSGTLSKLGTTLAAAGITSESSVASLVSLLQGALNIAFGVNQFTVVPAGAAQAALTQGVNSNGIVGTAWSGVCGVNQCGGGSASGTATIYFQPDGTLTGFSEGNLLAGTWAGSTNSGGGVTVQITNGKGSYATGSFLASSGTATVTIYNNAGAVQGSFIFTKIAAQSSSAVTNTQYQGGWYATFTPNAAAIASGNSGGTAYLITAADGTLYGITDGSGGSFQGTWTPATGIGTAAWTNGQSQAIAIALDLAIANGTVTIGGSAAGTLTLSRTGTLTNNKDNSANAIPLLLNVVVSWANNGDTVSSLALALSVFDSSGNQVASAVKSESTAPLSTGVRTTTTDNIAVPYPTGGASTYRLSVGPANCTMTGSSGTINDANSGVASAYPTVYVTCDPNAAQPVVPLLLNVNISWANTSTSVSSFVLGLRLVDASGNQIASGIKSESTALRTDGVRTTTTDNIAVSYPTGSASTYSLSAGSQCLITGVSSGQVNDANSGNPNAYPTVTVVCP